MLSIKYAPKAASSEKEMDKQQDCLWPLVRTYCLIKFSKGCFCFNSRGSFYDLLQYKSSINLSVNNERMKSYPFLIHSISALNKVWKEFFKKRMAVNSLQVFNWNLARLIVLESEESFILAIFQFQSAKSEAAAAILTFSHCSIG